MQNSHYKIGSPIYNQRFRQSLEANEDPLSVLFAKKIYKINVRPKLVYYIELDYYEHTVFIKFYPKIMESEPDKFKKVGMGLKIAEVRKLLYTCCVFVYKEIQMSPQKVFSFVAQIYDRDNLLKRKKPKLNAKIGMVDVLGSLNLAQVKSVLVADHFALRCVV